MRHLEIERSEDSGVFEPGRDRRNKTHSVFDVLVRDTPTPRVRWVGPAGILGVACDTAASRDKPYQYTELPMYNRPVSGRGNLPGNARL